MFNNNKKQIIFIILTFVCMFIGIISVVLTEIESPNNKEELEDMKFKAQCGYITYEEYEKFYEEYSRIKDEKDAKSYNYLNIAAISLILAFLFIILAIYYENQ